MSELKRNYEVSVWTLQDEFIAVLKASNIENKGQIEEPDFHLADDGTEEFSFSIPMYLYEGKKKKANPLWIDSKNGLILQDMRKIKVTFNRFTTVSKTFEFIITKIEERHEKSQLYCDVTCEGLAFHELGKTGYKIIMNSDDFNDDDYQYFIGERAQEPHATLNYWMDKVLPYLPSDSNNIEPAQWYYKVDMDWSSYQDAVSRETDKIYEDPYVKSWNLNNSKYVPSAVEVAKEKERMVNISESNKYNITRDIAEAFGVFCKYEYSHDENLHIIGRTVIFYNSYMREKEGYIDLTYPYSTSEITRERDSNDLSTKMYVRPADDETSPSGQITIIDVPANKMREDYIYNFDYLLKCGNITPEQEEEIENFETKMGEYNTNLSAIEGPLMVLQEQVPELEGQETFYTNSIQLDKERISASNDLLNELTDESGELEITSNNPRTAVLLKSQEASDNGTYYINLTDKGVLAETVKIYSSYDFTRKILNGEISSGKPKYDNFNNLEQITCIIKDENMTNTVYLTYKFIPQLCYDNVRRVWETRLNKDESELEKIKSKLETTKSRIEILKEEYNTILEEKNICIKNFEKIMGPAIRESYWQPEDYTDYGNNYIDSFTLSSTTSAAISGDSELSEFFWDSEVIDKDQELEKTAYETGINQNLCGLPVIDLSGHETYLKNNYDKLSFMFYDFKNQSELSDATAHTPRNMKVFSAGSTAKYGFVSISGTIKPVLIITGFESLSDDSRARLPDNTYSPTVGVITTTISGTTITTTIDNGSWTPVFLNHSGNGVFTPLQVYYPRIKVNSLSLKIDDLLLCLFYNEKLLTNYEDYYVLTKDTSYWDDSTLITGGSVYCVTIKPEVILSEGGLGKSIKFKFNISNADISIYLDALKVLEENSQPKVSYTIQPSVVDKDFLYTLYNKLCRICNINDSELKFENVQGYISSINIDCDHPENDKIEIKNYKTKFEDLFSSIVAQTEEMKKNSYVIDIVSDSFGRDGNLSADLLQHTIDGYDFKFDFNNGKLIIDEKNGICSISDDGIVAFTGIGIFTATEKDEDGNWKLNTGILPQGINANLITTGQLDTNRIKIYAGDKVRFQLNSEGIFAYKSYFEDIEQYNLTESQLQKIDQSTTRVDDIDSAQYVVMNENGLFLWGKKDALVLNNEKDDYIKLTKDVARVEVSWEGFKLRNWNNDEVFYADPDTGNLIVKGTIYATNLYIGPNNQSFESAVEAINVDTINGTSLTVDTNTGIVTILANHSMQLATNGLLSIIGNGGVQIGSNVSIDMISGSSINMLTGNAGSESGVLINSDGIEVTGKRIQLRTSVPSEGQEEQQYQNVIDLSEEGINMETYGNVNLQGQTGSIQFMGSDGETAFSIDPQGTLICRKIICTGEITGIDATITEEDIQEETTTNIYTLILAEGSQPAYGATSHTRTSKFKPSSTLTSGSYVIRKIDLAIRWNERGKAPNDGADVIIQVQGAGNTSQSHTFHVSSWALGETKYFKYEFTTPESLDTFNNNFNSITVVTTITNYTTATGKIQGYTEWDLTYNNTIIIGKT